MAEIWLTSDTHFGHQNIIEYCGRPFSDTWEMDEALIGQWNIYVKPQDHIYHLGDVTMERGGKVQQEAFIKLIKRLNGHKRLILGNHDHFPIKTYIEAGFEKIVGTGRWFDNLILSHYPVHPTSIGGDANIHGHIHNNESPTPVLSVTKGGKVIIRPYINVCVEATNYHPITLGQVKERVKIAINQANGVEIPDSVSNPPDALKVNMPQLISKCCQAILNGRYCSKCGWEAHVE